MFKLELCIVSSSDSETLNDYCAISDLAKLGSRLVWSVFVKLSFLQLRTLNLRVCVCAVCPAPPSLKCNPTHKRTYALTCFFYNMRSSIEIWTHPADERTELYESHHTNILRVYVNRLNTHIVLKHSTDISHI